MRIALVIAAGLLWAGVAHAQTSPDTIHSSAGAQSAPEPSSSQAQSPAATGADSSTNTAQGQTADADHQMICHTSVATGSRLARHATRTCKTRQQWELEQQQDQEIIRHIGTVQGQTG